MKRKTIEGNIYYTLDMYSDIKRDVVLAVFVIVGGLFMYFTKDLI